MTDANELIKTFTHRKFTLKGRIFHPNLLAPKKTQNGREVFDTMFAWDKNDPANAKVMQEINAHLMSGMVAHQGFNPAALQNPIKHFDTYIRQDGKPNAAYLKGLNWCNPSTGVDYPPPVVKRGPMGLVNVNQNETAEVYSGRNAAVSISFYVMIPKAGAANQKRGFGVNIDGVLLLDGGDKEGGAAGINVDQVFGSFLSDTGVGNGHAAQGTHTHSNQGFTQGNGATTHSNTGMNAQNNVSHSNQQNYNQQQQVNGAFPGYGNGNSGSFV